MTIEILPGLSFPPGFFGSAGSSKPDLAAEFLGRDDGFWGVERDEEGTSRFREDQSSAVECTGFARAVVRKLPGRAEAWGFSREDNPGAGVLSLADGHDFAVVDGRYLVDPWLSEVESGLVRTESGEEIDMSGKGVLDLENPEDAAVALKVYGPRDRWRRL